MRLSRLYCETCKEETIHMSVTCCHCKTRFIVAALMPRLSDTTGCSIIDVRRRRGGQRAKLNPRRALPEAT